MTENVHAEKNLILRQPHADEGQALYDLIRSSPPLDLNSAYCYFLMTRHFRSTCIVADSGGALVGCVTGYMRPDEPETLFVWQVAVREDQRGQGLAGRMLEALLKRSACRHARYLETTVGPTNHASRRCFERLAQAHKVAITQLPFLDTEHFGSDSQHEAEVLLRIGPFLTQTITSAKHEGTLNGNL